MADNNSILEKLDGLVARFEEVSTLITDPAVIADQKRYVKLTKEYKDLDDLMKARKEYMQLLANIEEAKDILSNESDTDMREMAKEEMDNSQERLPVLEEEIKLLLVPADPQDGKNAILEIRGGISFAQDYPLVAFVAEHALLHDAVKRFFYVRHSIKHRCYSSNSAAESLISE